MERDNFYKDFRTKLESRKIAPSDSAWDILEAQLDAGNRPQKRNAMTYWVAASIAIVLIGSIYFTGINNDKTAIPVVDIENNDPAETLPDQQGPAIKKSTPLVQEETVKEESFVKKDKKPAREASVAHQQTDDPENAIPSTVAEDPRIDEMVAEIQKLSQEQNVIDVEVDVLLAQAQAIIAAKQVKTDTLGQIDAMALLTGVEEELDRTFKDKVFETLKESFYKVKTAVADRNN